MTHLILWIFLISSNSYADIPAFSQIAPSFKYVTEGPCGAGDGPCEVDKRAMPRIASQDGLGICYACVAATMMQAENCRILKTDDCRELPKQELISILDLTRYVTEHTENLEKVQLTRSAYRGLQLSNGGHGDPHATAILASYYGKRAANEECVSLDKILSKMESRGETVVAQKMMWARLEKHYQMIKEKKGCSDCVSQAHATALKDINHNLDLRITNDKILEAFGEESYEHFLDKLIDGAKCKKTADFAFFEGAENTHYKQFPKASQGDSGQAKGPEHKKLILGKIKEVLKGGRPVSLAGICLIGGDPLKCPEDAKHASVISGYREVCDQPKKGSNKPKCRQSLKVVNCWGKSWQDQNSDGWVDAEMLFQHTMLVPNILGWYENKEAK